MSSALGILVVVVGILLSVALHEVGHMVPAKRFGVLVPEYSVGFGPALWRRTVRGTTYVLRAVLLGGYVRIVGMYGPARPGVPTLTRKGRPTLAEEARRASLEEIPEGQESRAFYALSAPRKVVVMLAGPVTNLAICVVLMVVALVGIGVATPSTTLASVPATVTTSEGSTEAPARSAGIRAGDEILSWNGVSTPTWEDVRTAIAASGGEESTVVLRRDGRETTVEVTPVENADGEWVVGVVAGYDYVPASATEVLDTTWQTFTGTVAVLLRLPQELWSVGESLFTDAPRDSSGVVSVVGVGRIAGEITSAGDTTGGLDGRAVAASLLSLLASLNMALFVFNLIPLPPLDGGHVAGAVWEGLRRTVARLRGRGETGPADTARLMPLTYGVGAALVAMTVLLVAADVVDPVRLFG